MNKKLVLILVSLVLTGLIASCSYQIKVNPEPKVKVADVYPYKVGVYIENSQLSQEFAQSGYCLVGAVHTWIIPVGEALQKATINSFSRLFKEVESVKSVSDFNNNTIYVILNPSVQNFRISQTIKTEFLLKATIINSRNKVVYEKEFKGATKGSGPCMQAFCLGVFGGKSAFSNSVNQAFENAFEQFFADMLQTVDFNNINK